jgi:hypothetical protein
VMTEKVGTLELRRKRNGATKQRARKARQAVAPTGDSACSQPPPQGGQTDFAAALPGTLPAANPTSRRPDTDFTGLQGKGKRQRTSGSMSEVRQAKRPRSSGQPSYARVTHEGLRMAIICDGYPKVLKRL